MMSNGDKVTAKYKEQVIEDYKDNPLIEALPPILSSDESVDRIGVYPPINEREKELDVNYRFHCVERLFRYVQPLDKHLEIEEKFSRIIRQGYLYRNPLGVDYAAQLQKNYKEINPNININCNYQGRSTASSFSIIGISGIGKTTAIERVLSMYPQVIVHSEYQGTHLSLYQIPYLKLDCPFDGSIKGLCINFFSKVDSLLGTNYYQKFGSPRKTTVDDMMPKMAQISTLHCIGVLVIDEIQHLNAAKSGGANKMLNFFVNLVNTIGVPVVLVGTTKALSILQGEFRQARRSSGQGDVVWERMQKGDMWDLLLNGMWQYQWTASYTPLTDELREVLYDESQGIVDIAVKLYAMSQMKAIAMEKERITPQLIKGVARDHLQLVRPMINALKSGDPNRIAKYEDIKPVNIDGFLKDYKQKIRLQESSRSNNSGDSSVFDQVVVKLMELDIEPELAKKFADKVCTNRSSPKEVPSLVKQAFKLSLKGETDASPKKDRNPKQENKDKNDLRKILELSKKEKKPAYDLFLSKGYIKDPLQELN